MPMEVSYMGTKRVIAPRVVTVIEDGPPGPLLDLFSGICAVGSAVAPFRQIWSNDIQFFASTVAKAFFTSPSLPLHFDDAARVARQPYLNNRHALETRFSRALHREDDAFKTRELGRLAALEGQMPNVALSKPLERERVRLTKDPSKTPYRLFSITFSGGYLGLRQCIQVDSIRYAVDHLCETGQLDEYQHRWLCLALCQAVNKVSTTTGHFAQYIRVKEDTIGRFVAQRSRSVWHEWLRAIFKFSPLGTRQWRSRNKVYRQDAGQLLYHLARCRKRPSVIYADPPYTSDHYSRYYHLYETLLLYDYPTSEGIGRYRHDRFISSYSLKTQVERAMDLLICGCAKLGCRLVLSYPEHGLLLNPRETISQMIIKHFGGGGTVTSLDHYHSSLGGPKGHEKRRVKELIFTAG